MHALGSIALLLLASAVSAQRPPTERLLLPDVAFSVGFRSYSADFFNSLLRDSPPRLEVSQPRLEVQQAGRDRVAAPGADRNPEVTPVGADKDLAGPDIRPGDVNPTQTVAPEPATLILLGSGLAVVGAAALRRRRAKPHVR
jgi:hypothetical protein